MFYNLYLDKVCCKVFCIDTVLYDVKFQLIMRTFFLLILTESHVTSYRRITQKHDRMEPSATSVVLVQLSDRSTAQY